MLHNVNSVCSLRDKSESDLFKFPVCWEGPATLLELRAYVRRGAILKFEMFQRKQLSL